MCVCYNIYEGRTRFYYPAGLDFASMYHRVVPKRYIYVQIVTASGIERNSHVQIIKFYFQILVASFLS